MWKTVIEIVLGLAAWALNNQKKAKQLAYKFLKAMSWEESKKESKVLSDDYKAQQKDIANKGK